MHQFCDFSMIQSGGVFVCVWYIDHCDVLNVHDDLLLNVISTKCLHYTKCLVLGKCQCTVRTFGVQ